MKYKNRNTSSNIEDKRKEISNNAWLYMKSPRPISPTTNTFQKNMNTSTNYSFQRKLK